MYFQVLGPVVADVEGASISVRPGKEKLLLACLLAHPNRVVAADALAEVLWPDAETGVRPRLLPIVSRLRRALDAEPQGRHRLVSGPEGFLLTLRADELDAAVFQAQCARGQVALSRREFGAASEVLKAALSLWRGPAFLHCVDNDLTRVEAVRLDELHEGAREDWVEADLALGRHRELVPVLEMLVEQQQLRERRWAQLMVALYRSGRQADALAAYRRLSAILDAELGLLPNVELALLERQILRQDPVLQSPIPYVPEPISAAPRPKVIAPAMGAFRANSLVGRQSELTSLSEVIRRVTPDSGLPIVLVSGEAGAGKTALIAEACHVIEAEGWRVLYGRCDEDISTAYGPFVQGLNGLLPGSDSHPLHGDGPRLLPELTRLLLEASEPTQPPTGEPHGERHLLFLAVAELIGVAASRSPLVVVVDDLHWADEATLKLLTFLAGRPLGRAVVLGGLRPVETHGEQPLVRALASWRRRTAVTSISVSGLQKDEIDQLLVAAFEPGTIPAGLPLAELLHQETGGNPFYVTEMIRHFRQHGSRALALVRDAHDALAAGLPEAVRDSLSARVGSLGKIGVATLNMAAVIGQEFDLDVLSLSADVPAESLKVTLLDAERMRLLVASPEGRGRIRFAHSMIQKMLYDEQGPMARADRHGRVARALLQLHGDDTVPWAREVAHHLLVAAQTHAQRREAARWSCRAGDEELSGLAPEEAVRWYTRALAELDIGADDEERASCLLALGEAQRRAGGPYRQTLLDASRTGRRLGLSQIVIDSAMASSRGMSSKLDEVDPAQVELFEEALLCAQAPGQRAELLAALAVELSYDPDSRRCEATGRQALQWARASGDQRVLLDVLLRVCLALGGPDRVVLRQELLAEASRLAPARHDAFATFTLACERAVSAVERSDIDEVISEHEPLDDLAMRFGQPLLRWYAALSNSWRALLLGNPGRAEQLTEEARQIGTDLGQPDAQLFHDIQLFHIRWHQGQVDEMLPAAQASTTRSELDGRVALALALAGHVGAAEQVLTAAYQADFPTAAPIQRATDVCAWGLAAAEVGDTRCAKRLCQLMSAWPDLVPATGLVVYPCLALVRGRLLGLLGETGEAADQLRVAFDRHRRLRAPFFLHLTQQARERQGIKFATGPRPQHDHFRAATSVARM